MRLTEALRCGYAQSISALCSNRKRGRVSLEDLREVEALHAKAQPSSCSRHPIGLVAAQQQQQQQHQEQEYFQICQTVSTHASEDIVRTATAAAAGHAGTIRTRLFCTTDASAEVTATELCEHQQASEHLPALRDTSSSGLFTRAVELGPAGCTAAAILAQADVQILLATSEQQQQQQPELFPPPLLDQQLQRTHGCHVKRSQQTQQQQQDQDHQQQQQQLTIVPPMHALQPTSWSFTDQSLQDVRACPRTSASCHSEGGESAADSDRDFAQSDGTSDYEDAYSDYGTTEEEEENNSIAPADLEALLADNAMRWGQRA